MYLLRCSRQQMTRAHRNFLPKVKQPSTSTEGMNWELRQEEASKRPVPEQELWVCVCVSTVPRQVGAGVKV